MELGRELALILKGAQAEDGGGGGWPRAVLCRGGREHHVGPLYLCGEPEASSPSVVNVNNESFIHKVAVTWVGTTRGWQVHRTGGSELLCTAHHSLT